MLKLRLLCLLLRCVLYGETLGVKGVWTIQEHDPDGNLLTEEVASNRVTASGRGLIWDIILGTQPTIAAVAIGSSSQAVQDSDATLVTELSRWQITSMSRSGSIMTVRLFLGTTQANGFTYREAGIFNGYPSGGVMLNRITHPDRVKTSSKTLTYLITLTLNSI